MGRTTRTATNFIDDAEHGIFGSFLKSCTSRERAIVALLFSRARRHITAISMSGHLLPFETTLLAMQLEQQRQLEEIRAALEKSKR